MRFEESSGGIVLRRAQAFGSEAAQARRDKSTKKKEWEVLLVQHSQHHGWGFAKGLIDKGEDKKTTALREVSEEGGVRAKIVKELPPTEYFYQFQGDKIKKKVIYFLMEYISGDPANHDWEMEDAQWVPQGAVEEKLSFKSDKEVFQRAEKFIKS